MVLDFKLLENTHQGTQENRLQLEAVMITLLAHKVAQSRSEKGAL